MARTKSYSNPPATPRNQWVRDALTHAGDMSFPAAAEKLSRAGLGKNYDKSIVQKMTVARGVTAEEVKALSAITGFPPPPDVADDTSTRIAALPPEDQALVRALLRSLEEKAAARSGTSK